MTIHHFLGMFLRIDLPLGVYNRKYKSFHKLGNGWIFDCKMGISVYERVTNYYVLKYSSLTCTEIACSEFSMIQWHEVPLFTTSAHYIFYSPSSHSSILIWQSTTLITSTGSVCVFVCVWLLLVAVYKCFVCMCVSVCHEVGSTAPVE